MLSSAALHVANHMLLQEEWARARLRPYCGQTLSLAASPVFLTLKINSEGLLEACPEGDFVPSVTIAFPDNWAHLAFSAGSTLSGLAKISGPADLAEVLGFVFKNLRWDAESELSRWVGDIAAHRMVRDGKRFLSWHRDATQRLQLNLKEFLGEEGGELRGPIARRDEVAWFRAAVDAADEECARLERRLLRLELR
jgi:ubiquinone biosynthesis protein UbiJ